jgi:hypothetical protein
MRELLIAEMKRAIEIMEDKPEMKKRKVLGTHWTVPDKDNVELRNLFLNIRRHTLLVEKGMKDK